MDLCGWMLPTLLGFAALGVFVFLAIGRPRPRNRWRALATRVGLLLVLNVLVLALAGALLNNEYSFYANWSDLTGGTPPSKTAHYGGPVSAAQVEAGSATFAGVEQRTFPPLPQPGRRVQRYRVAGERSGFDNEVLVRLPEHYDPRSARRYPVILALHGFPGTAKAFGQLDGFYGHLDAAMREHRLAEAIVVMPLINRPSTLDSECVDAPGGPRTETWLAHDVPRWVMTHLAARAGRQSWATYGYSFGGWCAAMLGMRHPEIFGGAVVFQGYFRPEFDGEFQPFRPGSRSYSAYDLIAKAKKGPSPLAMWVFASKQDRISYPSTKEFLDAARAPLSITADTPDWGGHRTGVWLDKVPMTLAWLGRSLTGFQPQSGVAPSSPRKRT